MVIESKAFWAIYDELAPSYDSQGACEEMAYCIYYALWNAGLLKKHALAKGSDARPGQ